jgi:hypothetical protein
MATGSVEAVGDGFLTTTRDGARVKLSWDISVECPTCREYILIMFFYEPGESKSVEMLVKHNEFQRKAVAEDWQFWQIFNVMSSVLGNSRCEWPWDSQTHGMLYDLELP